MKFLDGLATQRELARLIPRSRSIRIAVAFWGQPAPKILGLLDGNRSTEIICNLKMGGTNPDAISELLRCGVDVQQSDRLHGKVYLFDDEAILGSSNASANGLSLQGQEVQGWHEANVLLSNRSILSDLSNWFEKLPRRPIDRRDLEAARTAWSNRRYVGIISPPSKAMLIDDLRKDPSIWKGRRISVCVYSEDLSSAAKKILTVERPRQLRSLRMRLTVLKIGGSYPILPIWFASGETKTAALLTMVCGKCHKPERK